MSARLILFNKLFSHDQTRKWLQAAALKTVKVDFSRIPEGIIVLAQKSDILQFSHILHFEYIYIKIKSQN